MHPHQPNVLGLPLLLSMDRLSLEKHIQEKKSVLCVGLDAQLSQIPSSLPGGTKGYLRFLTEVVDATAESCVAYKPNLAFFEGLGPDGWVVFKQLCSYIRERHPRHFLIADAKRGDIGNTAEQYASAFFEVYGCHAVTVAPYMGKDSVEPFLQHPGHWAIVLGLTSNPGSHDFQRQQLNNANYLFEEVLFRVAQWGTEDNLMFVIGATHPAQLLHVRKLFPRHIFLVPGVGAQGGTVEAVMHAAHTPQGGVLINASRSVLFASSGPDFAEAAAAEARRLHQEMKANWKGA